MCKPFYNTDGCKMENPCSMDGAELKQFTAIEKKNKTQLL